ncbi:MAG: Threonylcarbamoyladenosine tRNA methylthiotransferase MtaB [candidate division WS2 bacterium]|uniref:tRNA (N(6)-L-threonylcarbamoyladenosine(37)-C(2))-methylthiotransferase n=1 Tax=Psychracetigena formicireducens TaxID=2986056 RepID=A0A9E2BNH4_PSYF1|nr:Threonylcarbamoyladenosine tRNA methylthiotransferase MtaB [Candidatus Psychracetigena formicireducens]
MKIAVLTLGCKTNQAESMQIEHALGNSGHQIVDMAEKPEICIINTCTVTSKADYQSRQLIHRALKNNSKVIVTGCYAELNREQLKKAGSDIEIVKNVEKDKIINLITQNISGNTKMEKSCHSITPSLHPPVILSRHRPIIKVQDGCNYSCSYCAIPMARGRSRSISEDEVIKEIKFYESMGYKEVVLTGIHLGTYGLDLKPKKSLSLLVNNILINTNIPRIRLSSLEIKEITDELLELFDEDRVCKHLHIPLQSGDDNTLKLMNRTYSVDDFVSGIEKITKKLPDIAIGTDVIVGFPGEGEFEFKNTKYLIESMPFSYLHVFPYSSRSGTKAAVLPKQVAKVIKKERADMLKSIGMAKKQDYIKRHIGKTLDVIVENRCDKGLTGTTGNYIKVLMDDANAVKEGMLVNVRILGQKDSAAVGSLAKNP